LLRDTGFLTTSVPAAPTFTTSWRPSLLRACLGEKSGALQR
jgi:hypothetical protein